MKISCICSARVFEIEKDPARPSDKVTLKTKSSGLMRKIFPDANVYMRRQQYCADIYLSAVGAIVMNAMGRKETDSWR